VRVTAVSREASVAEDRTALEVAITALEALPQIEFRAAAAPADEIERRATEIGAIDLAMRARLLRAMALIREGGSPEGGQWAHQVLAWAQEFEHSFLTARAHRALSIFFRLIGDLAEALAHAVQCFATLDVDEPDAVRARHLMTLAVSLDEAGSLDGTTNPAPGSWWTGCARCRRSATARSARSSWTPSPASR